MSNKVKRTPKLRFPEFRKEPGWEETALNMIVSPIVREREKPASTYTGLGIRSHGKGTFLKPLEQPEKTSMERLYEVECDDLVVNITFAWEGAVAIAKSSDAGTLVSHRFPTFVIDRNVALPEFLQYPILGKQFIYQLGVISPGGAGRNRVLNKSDFLKLELPIPSIAEQRSIATCLGSLDELIAAEGQKLESLRAYKKGLMQQLFPRPGETTPRMRFPQFHDLWHEATFDSLATSISSGKDKADPDGEFDLYGSTGVIGKTSVATFNGTYLLVARVGANAGLLTMASGSFGVTDNTLVIVLKKQSSIEIVFHYLESIGLNNMVFGSGQPLITGGQLKSLVIRLPKEAEQQRVAECLSSLDAQIAAQTERLTALRTHKKGLMQQLFPAVAEGEA